MNTTILFPLNNTKSYFDVTTDELSTIKQNIKNLLLTYPGDRVIRRKKIGIPVNDIFFETDKEEGLALLKTYLEENINKYFNGVKLNYVKEVEKEQNEGTNRISIEIRFTDLLLGDSDSLIITN